MFGKLELTEKHFEEINSELCKPDIISDQGKYKSLMKELKNLTPVVEKYREYKKENGKLDINFKWLIFALLAFAGNAGCCIVQRTQQMAFNGKYGDFLMMAATGLSAIVCGVIYFTGDKEGSKLIIAKAGLYPVIAGICNVLLNLFVIFLATSSISPSLIYPVISVGGIAITIVFSALVFKEKMNLWQWFGLFLGAVATGLLSI